jgi:phosphatidylserine/phosphatidylglycerophosphate/cardiolipin synthase-like enzyme
MPDLRALEARWFDRGIVPVHGGTVVEPLVDGERYHGAILEAIARTATASDSVLILAWQLDPGWRGLGQLLASRADGGVDVRIVLNCTPSPINPWRANHAAARELSRWPSLARGLVLDWSGATWTGSHHQKAVLVRAGGETVGFVAGMDLVEDHCDRAPHTGKVWRDGTPWGWHDVGVRVRGAAVGALWECFRARWAETTRRPGPAPLAAQAHGESSQSAQILRTCFRWRSRVHELHRALRHAIGAAERYIYVEDQFLGDGGDEILALPFPFPFPFPCPAAVVPIPPEFSLFAAIAARLRERPALKVIFVGSGKSDPLDAVPGPRNRRLTRSVRAIMTPNVAVWRVEDVTVHSKVVLIDDEYAAVGSANFNKRSMYGIDDELQVAFVDASADGAVRRLRRELWSELWGRAAGDPADDLDRSLLPWFSGAASGALVRVTR